MHTKDCSTALMDTSLAKAVVSAERAMHRMPLIATAAEVWGLQGCQKHTRKSNMVQVCQRYLSRHAMDSSWAAWHTRPMRAPQLSKPRATSAKVSSFAFASALASVKDGHQPQECPVDRQGKNLWAYLIMSCAGAPVIAVRSLAAGNTSLHLTVTVLSSHRRRHPHKSTGNRSKVASEPFYPALLHHGHGLVSPTY